MWRTNDHLKLLSQQVLMSILEREFSGLNVFPEVGGVEICNMSVFRRHIIMVVRL